MLAISGTRGSSGLASVSNDEIDSRTFEMVRAGDHWSFKMSRQIDPLALMLGWQILVVKLHLGGRKGQSVGKLMFKKNTPPAQGLSSGPTIVACQWNWSLSDGPAEQFAGGSFCKSASSFRILLWAIFSYYNLQEILHILNDLNADVSSQKSSAFLKLTLNKVFNLEFITEVFHSYFKICNTQLDYSNINHQTIFQMSGQEAYFLVHSFAVASNLGLLSWQSFAISGSRGFSGLMSTSNVEMASSTFEMVSLGDHWSFRISRQIEPLALMLGWQILVLKLHLGGRKGQSAGNWMTRLNTPPAQGVCSGPMISACQSSWSPSEGLTEQLGSGYFSSSAISF